MKKKFLNLSRLKKQVVAAATDFVCIPLTLTASIALHLNSIHVLALGDYWILILAAPFISIPIFVRVGLYRAVIRYIDHKIVLTVAGGAVISVMVLAALGSLLPGVSFSLSPYVIFGAILILYLLISRFTARGFFLGDRRAPQRMRVAIYGAGHAGIHLANALRPSLEYLPVVFLDDNPQLQKTTIAGIKVYCPTRIRDILEKYNVAAILLAMPALNHAEQRAIIDKLTPLKIKIKVTPPIQSLVKGELRAEDVREVEIEDLLSRDTVAPNSVLLPICITGKSVAVSGAGGSIGSELCRQIVKLAPTRLIMLEMSEYALYAIDQELRAFIALHKLQVELVPFMGSVLDYHKSLDIFKLFEVETVYHAAAYKHVPLVEQNPVEGIRNNVFGTLRFARAAVDARVKCFVLISTDKAVRPTNVMGSTKRLAELILQAFSRQHVGTRFCMVRFGNVLGSSGSVVPLFRRQIAAGGPVTLTHPEITRYFMTIPEAAQLVLQAGAMGTGGDVFVLDMGDPVKIADLAKKMINLSGREVSSVESPDGIELRFVGLRPGEKLYEELLIGDNATGTEHPLIMRAQEAEIAWPFLELMLNQLEAACVHGDHDAIRRQLQKIVPEFKPSSVVDDHLWKLRLNARDKPNVDDALAGTTG
ncbi:nucleoside-diphosphate sugar epimerase/dehydratase [Massilia sp. S19_KUP03_FR1]|uniref:nucleoside-diphosphate sugar epimerase/dehydratase n=1 Tax=Massilia sp. S19_KUP03_FR1 TaxID=3025503 RepID=UPI002FCD85CC